MHGHLIKLTCGSYYSNGIWLVITFVDDNQDLSIHLMGIKHVFKFPSNVYFNPCLEKNNITSISNSVTHLQSFANTIIAEISGNATLTANIAARSCTKCCNHSADGGCHSSLVFQNILWVLYFTMFNNVLQYFINNRRMIDNRHIGNWTIANRNIFDNVIADLQKLRVIALVLNYAPTHNRKLESVSPWEK